MMEKVLKAILKRGVNWFIKSASKVIVLQNIILPYNMKKENTTKIYHLLLNYITVLVKVQIHIVYVKMDIRDYKNLKEKKGYISDKENNILIEKLDKSEFDLS